MEPPRLTKLQWCLYTAIALQYLYAVVFDPDMLHYTYIGGFVMPWDCEDYVPNVEPDA